MNKQVVLQNLGCIRYKECWEYQDKIFNEIFAVKKANRDALEPAATPNYLLLCEHPHVYTLGKGGTIDNLLVTEQQLADMGAEYFAINRGGDITYHGFGQLVGYPILDLDNFFNDLHKYLRQIEQVIIEVMESYGLRAGRVEGYTGVWIDHEDVQKQRKICAIGVRSSHWITMHGFALNVNTDLSYFKNIIPCGITDKPVTSLHLELGREIPFSEIHPKILTAFERVFGMEFFGE